MPELRLKSNDCLATNLQLVFSLMKETIRKSIDPSFFIKALGLDEHIQQVRTFELKRKIKKIMLKYLILGCTRV